MAASMDDGDGFQADDLYVLLNVDKKATNQEISKAYRRMSKIFHPDRHHDPEKKKQADIFFNKIKNAYEILSDPNKREIYNRYGMEGLNVQGLEIITRTKSPAEIIAELDRLKYEEEQRRLQRTSPAGEIEVRINATNLFGSSAEDADYEPDYEEDLTYAEITEIHVSQSVEYPLTPKDTTIIGGTVSTKNGIGSGNFLVGYRRQTSDKGWVQGNLGFGSGMTFGLQGYRQLTKRCYGKISTFLGTDEAMTRQTVGLSFLLSNQFDRCFRGEMALMVAVRPSLRTTIHYDNEQNRAIFSVQVGKNNFAKAVLERSFESHINNMRFEVILGNVGWFFSYGVKMKVSEFSMIHAKLKITNNGGVSLDMGARRGQQSYFFPIQLSEQVLPSSIFYGTFLPTIAYFAVKKLIIDPYVRRKESEDLKKKQERDSDELLQKKKDAEAAVELMQRTVEKSLEYETNRNGLIILKALYGRLATQDGELVDSECIDVKIPLQAQVTESQLIILESNTKSDLPGFYDPCPGQDKSLYIRYTFRNRPHQVTYDDKDPIRLPLQRHVMQDERDESFAHL